MCGIFTWVRARLGWATWTWAVCYDWASLYALQGIEPLSHAEGGRVGRVALERHGSRAHGSRRKDFADAQPRVESLVEGGVASGAVTQY
eukprot:scaffold2487_cov62-Phaeocystis_antarctica.AAC.4